MNTANVLQNGILPARARPAAKVGRLCSATPRSKARFGKALRKASVLQESAMSASRPPTRSQPLPTSSRASAKASPKSASGKPIPQLPFPLLQLREGFAVASPIQSVVRRHVPPLSGRDSPVLARVAEDDGRLPPAFLRGRKRRGEGDEVMAVAFQDMPAASPPLVG